MHKLLIIRKIALSSTEYESMIEINTAELVQCGSKVKSTNFGSFLSETIEKQLYEMQNITTYIRFGNREVYALNRSLPIKRAVIC